MTTLQQEIETYDALRADLEVEHAGQWALVHGRKLVALFDAFEAAASEAVQRFGRGPYLIRQVGSRALNLPASVVYGLTHAAD